MKFQYASDLHLEMFTNLVAVTESNLIPSAPILILAGDIDKIKNKGVSRTSAFKYFSDNWEQVYIIPGNHEFYDSERIIHAFELDHQVFPNVKYLNNVMLELDGVEFYFTTLWSKCNSNLIEDYITDFKICFWGDEKYRWTHHNQFHQRAVEWLDESLSKPKSKPRVVVSHFVPSNEVNAYPDSDDLIIGPMIKSYFVAQLDEYLKKWDIDYWIYGHNHWNNDVDVFGIKFRSNMLGYVGYNEHKGFIRDKTIEIV